MARERIYIYDTTLRDGQQTPGVDFSVEDKSRLSRCWKSWASIMWKAVIRGQPD